MIDKYGYPLPKDTPQTIRTACLPRSRWDPEGHAADEAEKQLAATGIPVNADGFKKIPFGA